MTTDPTNSQPPATPPARDERFTWGLVIEVFDLLERHGYRKASDAAGGRAAGILGDLVEAYEGRA